MNLQVLRDPSIRAKLLDPFWLIPKLYIEDRDGAIRPIGTLEPEQVEFVRAFVANPMILVLKARQVGISTIACACFVWLFLLSPDAAKLIQVTHEGDATASMNGKIRLMLAHLPSFLRPVLSRDTAQLIEMAHNHASFRQRMAGGRSQGRGFSFQHAHFTEMAFYPSGSSAVKGRGVDRRMWASVRATMKRGKSAKTVVESTANGPSGLYYHLATTAQRSPDWKFLFWPWFFGTRYQAERLPRTWELTDDERELLSLYADLGLTQRHLAWRRSKMEDEGLGPEEFRLEYPSNPSEPFLLTQHAHFDIAMLNRLAARCDMARCPPNRDLVVYEPFLPGRTYGIGMDTSGGLGQDFAVVVVVRDDGKLVARWHSNKTRVGLQAKAALELSASYGNAPILVEINRHGKFVYHELCRLGANVWLDADGKPWWTQGGRNDTKGRLLDWSATLLAEGYFLPADFDDPWIVDSLVVQELGRLRENPKTGNIEAPEGEHDDHAMAWMFALWCIRGKLRARPRKLWTPEAARQQAARQAITWRAA